MARLSVYVLVLVGASGTATAQHARYPRQQPTPTAVVLSDRVKPRAQSPAPAQAATKPTLDAEAVLSIENLKAPARTEQEQILADLIMNTPDSEAEEKSDYYFRLAELYAKQQLIWRKKASELAMGTTPEQRKQAAAAAEQAKLYLLKTVKTFKGLTDNDAFRNYPKLDAALFVYGYTLQSGKYLKEARMVYDKLLKNFPNSKYVPEAHLAFADYYFDAGQLADAEARYKQVLKFPKSGVYAYALYKLGWIHLQLSRSPQAAESFYQVVVATRGDAKQAELYRAARADFARAYAQIGKPDRAFEAFQKLDKSAAAELTELLADLARDGGSPERAVATYRELLAHARGDARACRWQYQLAHATLSLPGATSAAQLKEVDELVRVYKSQKAPDDECRANAAAMSSELAAVHHAAWAQTQDAESLARAEQLYALHIGAFPDAAAQRAQYAEVLWTRADREANAKLRSERWVRAADVFATIETLDASRAAALAWMNALDVVAPSDAKVMLGKPPRSRPKPRALKGHEAKLVAAVTAYASQAKAPDEELAQMRLAIAVVLRSHRHFDEAATVLDQFLLHHQSHTHAELAANLMLDSMIQARQLDDVVEVGAAIAADRTFLDGKPQLQQNLLLLRSLLR